MAGLNVLNIMNEPTATAVTFGLKGNVEERNVVVIDLGGGTFDVSILTLEEGIFEVKATNGDTHLGGRDFDNRGVDFFEKEISKEHSKEINIKEPAFQQLSIAFEQAKRTLSDVKAATLDFDFELSILRAKFVCWLFVCFIQGW